MKITGLNTLSLIFLIVAAQFVAADTLPPATGYGELPYDLAAPGTYQLPAVGRARDGQVLSPDGQQTSLYDVFDDQYVLLSFIYSSCNDINGCPLTSYVSWQIKAEMREDDLLADNLKLVSVSFDPEVDTPEVMKLYAENFKYAGAAGDWQFLTTDSVASLAPILTAYEQDIQRQYSLDGTGTKDFSHILRVFLIDPQKQIRNIYSVSFLHKDVILNDVNTLFIESGLAEPAQVPASVSTKVKPVLAGSRVLPGPGDNKAGYESETYITRSRNLENRLGQAADLLGLLNKPPLGLPVLAEQGNEPTTKAQIQLGRRLFYDRRLSLNETFSCAMCHIPEQGFTSNELSTAVGVEGRSVRRNSPTIYNVAYSGKLFHDARESTLEQQVWGPLLARNEMANPSVGHVVDKIKSLSVYDGLFEAAFAGRQAGMETIGAAFAAYQRSLLSANSPFDRWFFAHEKGALNEQQRAGFRLFSGKAGCVACHIVGKQDALFMDNKTHNTGHGYEASLGRASAIQRVQLAPGQYVEVDRSVIAAVSEPRPADVGVYEITQNPQDRWKYKTPTLRNIELTAPYMHDGRFTSLPEVVNFYNSGGIANSLLSPLIKPLGLNDQEIDALVAFLLSLTGDNVDLLVADAFAAPVGDHEN